MSHARDDLTPPTWALLWALAERRHRAARPWNYDVEADLAGRVHRVRWWR